jgi:hypothetical protein
LNGAAVPVGDVAPPAAPFKIETVKGNSVKVGLLLQPQFQALSSGNQALSGFGLNLYLRRARFLIGGTLFGTFDYFVETDFANLFLPATVTTTDAAGNMTTTNLKATPGTNIQDAFATYHPVGDVFKVDAGYMLPPLAHNAIQGAGTLYGLDYYPFTFQSSNSFGSSANPIGRDLGVQLRGLLLGGHLEYRAGLFQGVRDVPTTTDVANHNFFRAVGRLQINLFDPETGFFYAGTYFGAKKIVSLGGSADFQDNYKYFAGDLFVDYPLGPGVLTLQFNFGYWNGGTFIPALLKQTAEMLEVGYLIGPLALAPIFQFNHLQVTEPAGSTTVAPNQTRFGGGLAFFPFGHNSNVKLFYSNVKVANEARAFNQINLQWQIYFF